MWNVLMSTSKLYDWLQRVILNVYYNTTITYIFYSVQHFEESNFITFKELNLVKLVYNLNYYTYNVKIFTILYYILESQINETLFDYCLKFDIVSNGQSLCTNWFKENFLQLTRLRLIKPFTCTFSYMTYWISHIICLDNIGRWFYNELEMIPLNRIREKLWLLQLEITSNLNFLFIYFYLV